MPKTVRSLADLYILKEALINSGAEDALLSTSELSQDQCVNDAQSDGLSDHYNQKCHLGRIKWFGGKNSRTGKSNEFGFITTTYGYVATTQTGDTYFHHSDVYFHQSDVISELKLLREGVEVVFFDIEERKGQLAAGFVQVIGEITDKSTIRALFLQGDVESRKSLLKRLIMLLSPLQLLNFATNELASLEPKEIAIICRNLGPKLLISPSAFELRCRLTPNNHLEILSDSNYIAPYIDEVLTILRTVDFIASPTAESIKFWEKHAPKNRDSPLYPFLPLEIKNNIWRDKTLPYLPIKIRVMALLREKAKLSLTDWDALVLKLICNAQNEIERRLILDVMPVANQLEYIESLKDWTPYTEMVFAALEHATHLGVADGIIQKFWIKHLPTSPKETLYKFAPTNIQSSICRSYYAKILNKIINLFNPSKEKPSALNAVSVYENLTDEDRKLAALWERGGNSAVVAQMLSARGAEKAAIRFYEAVGFIVEDIAILQLDGNTSDWRTHDLLLNENILIDVKNARCPVNSKNFYVEHTVPRFKQNRHSQPVRIAGVLSPYLNLQFINNPNSAYFSIQDIRYLGETSFAAIEALINHFNTEKFEIRHSSDRTIPHWLFDYPDAWYKEFNTRKQEFNEQLNWPTDEEWPLIYDSDNAIEIVPMLCAIGKPLPLFFQNYLTPWKVELYRKIQRPSSKLPRLPFLFLLLLTDFLQKIGDEPPSYSPAHYRELLYGRKNAGIHDHYGPFGLIDPLGIIDSICSSLETLWNSRHAINLDRFVSFRFSGLGLLQGREGVSYHWQTILAYCGGKEYGRDDEGNVILDGNGTPQRILGKCGKSPLVLGQEKLCDSCHKLICSSCGFCSPSCEHDRFSKQHLQPSGLN